MDKQNTSPRGKGRVKTLLRLVEGSKRFFIGGILLAWLTSVLDLINPKIISFTVDAVIGNETASLSRWMQRILEKAGGRDVLRGHLGMIALCVLGVALLAGLGRYAFRVLNVKGQEAMLKHTRNLLYEHIMALPLTWHNRNHTGDIIQRCTSDVDVIRAFLSEQLTTLIRMVVSILLSLGFMLTISPKLTGIVAIFVPLMIGFSYVFHKKIEASFEKVDAMEGKLSAIAQENLTGVRVVRAFGREAYERERFETSNEEYTGLWKHLMRLLSLFWATSDALAGLQTLAILVLGALLCLREEMTAGGYIAFLSYCGMIAGPVRMLGRVISGMSRAGVSIDRIRYILEADREVNTRADKKPQMTGDILFDHVSFAYDGSEEKVIDDITFTAPAGKVTGILGSTGSGKSTLMYLLCRLYDLEEGNGKITVGGVDLADMDRAWVREHVGIVLQEPYLFSKTLGENIAITDKDSSMESIQDVARIAALEETIEKFSKGYDTFVGERGVTLSGGQKQRAAIAQTLLRDTPITILDDSLSAVDAQTDAKIRKELEGMHQSTRILISHRITTLMHADRIIVLDKGKVEETGTHESLYAHNGLYRKICDMQSPEGAMTHIPA
ncbi:MAG: ABC transporter ATP-binding protein [Clostridia bacterium]|nr:ABC transporter ATP-binding protein [Clostridia bacterium]